jgi:hypothetical protein
MVRRASKMSASEWNNPDVHLGEMRLRNLCDRFETRGAAGLWSRDRSENEGRPLQLWRIDDHGSVDKSEGKRSCC